MNSFFYVAIGAAIGAGTVAGLWIHDNEKKWTPPEDMAVDAWEYATGKKASGMRSIAAKVALIWYFAWIWALRRPRGDQ